MVLLGGKDQFLGECNLPSVRLNPFPFVLSPQALGNSFSPSFLQVPSGEMALLLWQDLSPQTIPSMIYFLGGIQRDVKARLQFLGDYCISLILLLGPLNSIFVSLRHPSEKNLVAWIGLGFFSDFL